MPKPLKVFLITVGIVADAVVIIVSLAFMVAGYLWWGGIALALAFGSMAAAAWYWHRTPEPPAPLAEWLVWDGELDEDLSDVERAMLRGGCVPADAVDAHAAQMIRALTGRPAVLSEQHLLLPPRPARPDNPQALGGN